MRTNMKSHTIKKKIFLFIKKNNVVTSSEIAARFNLSWNTADKYLLELVIEKKVKKIKKRGVNLWILN